MCCPFGSASEASSHATIFHNNKKRYFKTLQQQYTENAMNYNIHLFVSIFSYILPCSQNSQPNNLLKTAQ